METERRLSFILVLGAILVLSGNLVLASGNSTETSTGGRSMDEVESSEPKRAAEKTRAGRMLDLDHMAGDIGKESKVLRDQELRGQRQSRILSEDLVPAKRPVGKQVDARSSKKARGKKKMEIRGFIPIVSLEGKEGKQLESADEADDQEPEQLMSAYGGQTSIGHASFSEPQQVAESEQSGNGDGHGNQQQNQLGRANRGLMSANNLLAPSKRFVSNLVAPLQLASASHWPAEQQVEDCICVPFFQCRSGVLSEWQLSKGQLLQANQQTAFAQIQVPRSLKQTNDLTYATSGAPNQKQVNEQQVNEFIYEQLRKKIESENLEQQVQQDYSPLSLIDERSKESASGREREQPEGRSPQSFMGANRRQGQQKWCGLMRTCCRIPHLQRGQQWAQQAARLGGQVEQPQTQMQHFRPQMQHFRPQAPQPQPQFDLVSPQSSFQQLQAHKASEEVGQEVAANEPVRQQLAGAPFMAGRCGTRQTMGIGGRVQNSEAAQSGQSSADFGEFPAHAAILKRISAGDSLFVCSAVLISSQWLATAAHCVRKLRPDELKVRLGEWDVSRDDEFYPNVEANVRRILVHPDFQPTSLSNDIALLRVESPLELQQMPHVAPACLPAPDEQFDGQRCWLAGWGKDAFGQAGAFQPQLRKVDLPVVGRAQCESALRQQTKLGAFFRLHRSSICAGGERGKDACEGDGGAGLYCIHPQSGLMRAAGLVSWGVGCGQVGVPGVYTSLAQFERWIESVADVEESELDYKNLISERSNANATISLAPEPAPSQSNKTQIGA